MKEEAHVARVGGRRGAFRVMVWRPEGNRPLGRPRSRCEHYIKMDLEEMGLIWIGLWTGDACF
jgi:hypothetical protein